MLLTSCDGLSDLTLRFEAFKKEPEGPHILFSYCHIYIFLLHQVPGL